MNGLREELVRRKKVSDQMVTAHSVLCQRFERYDRWLSITQMIAAFILLCASIVALFQPTLTFEYVILDLSKWIVFASIVSFIVAIIDWRIRWRDLAVEHRDASREWVDLKLRMNAVLGLIASEGISEDSSQAKECMKEYDAIARTLKPIPDHEFVILKTKHRRKVRLSRAADVVQFVPLWLLGILLFMRDFKKACSNEHLGE